MTTPTVLLLFALLLANTAPTSLDQVKAEPAPEKRARAAVDFSFVAQKGAESAYSNGDLDATVAQLKTVVASLELASESLKSSGRTPGRNPGIYKYAEQKSQELLLRLRDLEQRMDDDERHGIAPVKARVQEIHDEWFEGIMERRK